MEEMIEEELCLTDLLDVETLQKIQDAFCKMTNIAAGISDENGVAITKDSISSNFCMNFNKKSPIGRARCEYCDKCGGEMALKEGHPVIYNCHAGLVDFSAPIMAHGQMVGSFIGGQVRTGPVNEEALRKIAVEIGVDPDEYVAAAHETKVVDQTYLKRATEFIYVISNLLSDMAYNRYLVMQANKEVERVARMKSDFLANMSHEIRTPMNAVIGMAEMAMREELPPLARDYIMQIKSSGNTLLAIINDILDFSKIESGKMDIIVSEYEPMSIINDVANIIMTRIGEKEVELILDIAPDLPRKLLGDANRIKQIIVNLSNNAVKFTKKGQVVLKLDYEKISEEEIDFKVSIQDTGIGIKEQDLGKLFQSFQQVDSKRNRNEEGTGLGLAISKRLVSLMNGEIGVESKYGEGSTFSFHIPQTVTDIQPSIVLKDHPDIVTAGIAGNPFLRRHLKSDMERLGLPYVELDMKDNLDILNEKKVTHVFVDKLAFNEKIKNFIKQNPHIKAIVMIDFHDSMDLNISNILVVKKPLYVLNIATILNGDELHMGLHNFQPDDFEFIAPEANILVVDDNKINLTVTEGLLKPLQMNIEVVLSGKEAIECISKKRYDLIFMDHMMPELDGVETTHIIRRFHPEYDDVPIIALTANAVDGVRDMFIKEGMNDFVAKPIEMRTIVTKLRYWLPDEKIQKVYEADVTRNPEEDKKERIQIEGLDVELALKFLGTEDLFWSVLKDYYKVIEKKIEKIRNLEQVEDWANYTIEVHALKSASKQIGAIELSKMAEDMENAGNQKNGALIHQCTGPLLEKYQRYFDILKPYFPEETKANGAKGVISKQILQSLFSELRNAMDNLDMDEMDQVIQKMQEYEYRWEDEERLSKLVSAVEDLDVDTCEDILCEWEKQY